MAGYNDPGYRRAQHRQRLLALGGGAAAPAGTVIGAGIGAGIGGLAGSAAGGVGALPGAAAGAGIGGAIGGGLGTIAGAGLGYAAEEQTAPYDEQVAQREAKMRALRAYLSAVGA